MIPQAEITPTTPRRITRNNIHSRAYFINESILNTTIFKSPDKRSRRDIILLAIDFLDVENSLRYRKENQKTFCNIYVADVARFIGGYIPRVWWKEDAIIKINRGETIKAEYKETVYELDSNGIFKWLKTYGGSFGWERVEKWRQFSRIIKCKGTIGVIASKGNTNQENGHTCIVYYNKNLFRRVSMSEAGQINSKKFFNKWWNKYKDYGYWYLSISPENIG